MNCFFFHGTFKIYKYFYIIFGNQDENEIKFFYYHGVKLVVAECINKWKYNTICCRNKKSLSSQDLILNAIKKCLIILAVSYLV